MKFYLMPLQLMWTCKAGVKIGSNNRSQSHRKVHIKSLSSPWCSLVAKLCTNTLNNKCEKSLYFPSFLCFYFNNQSNVRMCPGSVILRGLIQAMWLLTPLFLITHQFSNETGALCSQADCRCTLSLLSGLRNSLFCLSLLCKFVVHNRYMFTNT